MTRASMLLVAGALAIGGAGVWLGRSTSASSEAAPAAAPAIAAAPRPAVVATPRPSLSTRSAAAVRMLAADLADADPKVRRAAVREVAKDPAPDAQVLLAASRDPDISVGVLAVEGLGKLHASGALPAAELIQRAGDHAINERVRLAAINALGVVQTPESAAFLADLLARGDTFERANAAILIGHQDLEIAMPALIKALGDSDEHVRSNAAETLRTWSRGHDFGSDAAAWQAWWQSRPR